MNRQSKTNHYHTSSGETLTRAEFDRHIREAKAEKVSQQLNDYGYNFCQKQTEYCEFDEECRILDCSHNTSVKVCVELGQAELAYNLKNLVILGRKCHKIKDGLNLKFKNS
ncbi:MAG: hypothetical protein WC389_21075 [Lutibacter sp.]|jgi:RNase P/RNase MRP subunit POP5